MSKRIFIQLSLALVALTPVACGLLASACGGSSSETPPPLEPDPRGNNYLGNYQARSPELADGGSTERPSRALANASEAPQPASPARSTWGTGRGVSPRPSGSSAPAPLK